MLRKLLSITSLLVLFSLFFNGCNLLQDDDGGDPVITPVNSGMPTGSWIESDSLLIVSFTATAVTVIEYDSKDSVIDTMALSITAIANDYSSFSILEPEGSSSIKYTLTENSLTLIGEMDETAGIDTLKFTKYTSTQLPSFWVEGSKEVDLDSLDIDTGGVDASGIPSGSWQIADTPMDEVIHLGKDTLVLLEYESSTKTMFVKAMAYTIDSTNKKFMVTIPGYPLPMAIPYSFSNDTMTIITTDPDDMSKDTIQMVAYKESSYKPAAWDVQKVVYGEEDIPDADTVFTVGSFNNGVPMGAWQPSDSLDELIVFKGDTMFFYEHENDTIFYDFMTYTIQNSAIMISMTYEDENGNEIDTVMAIPFSYSNGIMTVTPPDSDSSESFKPYTSTSFPTTWTYSVIVFDDRGDEGPHGDFMFFEGQWVDTNNDSIAFGLWFDDGDMKFHYVKMVLRPDSMVDYVKKTFTFDETTKAITFDDGTTASVTQSGDMLVLTMGTITHTLKRYGPTNNGYPDWWVVNFDGHHGMYDPFNGDWITSDMNMIVGLYKWSDSATGEMKQEYRVWSYQDSMINHDGGTYSFDENSGLISISNGYTATYDDVNDILTVKTPAGDITLTRYDMKKGYPDTWVLKDGGMTDHDVRGQWLLEGSNRTVVYDIFDMDIKVIKYNPADSTITDMKYSYNVSMDTVYLKDETGVEIMYSFEVMGDTMVLMNAAGTLMFTRLMEPLPLKEWILKEGDPYKHPVNGQWLEAGSSPMEALYIQPGALEHIEYDPMDSMMYVEYMPMEIIDQALVIKTPDNMTMTLPFTVSNDTLYLTDPETSEIMTFVRYDGMLPLAEWVIKDDHMNKLPFMGNWIIEGTDPDKIINIMETTIEFAKYFPTMKYYDWKKWEYYFDETTMEVVLKGMDGVELERTKPMVSDDGMSLTITIMGEMNTYVRYDGGIPHESWVLDTTNHDTGWVDPELPPFLGEWSTTDGNRITTVGPEVITHFVINSTGEVTLTQLKYMWSETTDTLYTKDPAGNQGWVLLKSDGQMLEITDVSGLKAVMYRHEGAIPAETWNITGGADLSFTKGAHINTWAISGDMIDEIVKIGPTLITIYEYWVDADGVSEIDTNYVDYTLNAEGTALVIHDMYSAGPEEIPFTVSGTTMSVTMKDDDTGEMVTENYTEYTGSIPHPDWK